MPSTSKRLNVLVGPAHWSGTTHAWQLRAVARALAARGHEVHYVETAQLIHEEDGQQHQPPAAVTTDGNLTVYYVHSVSWPPHLDMELAIRSLRGEEPNWKIRAALVEAAMDASVAFFTDAVVQTLLSKTFDVGVVDAGCLAGALLVDSLHPLPHVHFLSFPYLPPSNGAKAAVLESSQLARQINPRLQALRAALGLKPKPECSSLHVLTLIGHSAALHGRHSVGLPSHMHCVGSVRSHEPIGEASRRLNQPPRPLSRAPRVLSVFSKAAEDAVAHLALTLTTDRVARLALCQ